MEIEIERPSERVSVSRPRPPKTGILFEERWWLDAVAPGSWHEIIYENEGGAIRFPYVLRNWRGLTGIVMPPLTPVLGPFVPMSAGKYSTRLSKELELMKKILASLPRTDFINYCFSTELSTAYPITWSGLMQSVGYTYRLDLSRGLPTVWSEMNSDTRRKISLAEKTISVTDDLPLEKFIELCAKMFAWKKIKNPYPPETVRRVDAECARRGVRKILCARNRQGELMGAIYLAWDGVRAYHLMSARAPEFSQFNVPRLLLWKAIELASHKAPSFDFVGSCIPNVERTFRSFGARQVPFFMAHGMGRKTRAYLFARNVFHSALRLSPSDDHPMEMA